MNRKSSYARKHISSYPRWKIFTLSAITGFAALTAGGALVVGFNPGVSSTASTSLARQIGLPASNACNTMGSASFKATSNSPTRTVFKLNDVWHKNNPCLEDILEKVSSSPATSNNAVDDIHDFLYYQMLYVLSRGNVSFDKNSTGKKWNLQEVINNNERFNEDFNQIIYLGENDQPYDGMGQADFAYWAIRASQITRSKGSANNDYAEAYKKVALATAETLITSIDKGGLRTREKCGEKPEYHCSWFHSKTNPTTKTEDALTLNKHLQIVRDLKRMANKLRQMGTNLDKAAEYEAASLEGAHQMVYAKGIKSGTPNLFDFVPRKENGEGILESWVYYSYNGSGKGYFLNNTTAKNCGYHKRNLSLLSGILQEQGAKIDKKGFQKTYGYLGNRNILDFMVKTYEIKRDTYGLDKNTNTHKNGYFGSCYDSGEEIGADLTTAQLTYLKNY